MYRVAGTLSSGFELHCGRRNSSGLERGHLHYTTADLMPNIGHGWVWLVDALLDVFDVNNLSLDCVPPLFQSWQQTDTCFDPSLTWGIQFKALRLEGGGALPASLHTEEQVLKALASHKLAEMVARSDAAALERETGIASDERHLDELNDRVAKRARAQHALQ